MASPEAKFAPVGALRGGLVLMVLGALMAWGPVDSIPRWVGLGTLIVGLGINHAGPTAAQAIARSLRHLDRIATASADDLVAVDGVGPTIAQSVQQFFAVERNQVVVEKLRAAGVNFEGPAAPVSVDGPSLEGLTFVLTGGLARRSREEAGAQLEAHGAKVTGSVSKSE